MTAFTAPKPVARNQCWQVQELNGTAVQSFGTKAEADAAALRIRSDLQRPVRVRRTA